MDIQEARKEKRRLEQKIYELLSEFSASCGLNVVGVRLDLTEFHELSDRVTKLIGVDVETRI